ncbi:DUF1549 domain-containing protein [Prosthecobacter sp.]|uniref:DUF1549 domain-containing protein n=1 Tax=Prosthecobacter sp. TaxID=1965333 RepID=UPI001D24AD8D|nr:DUF1549 domain-containing protein [Prosthecobacter sp.]MCB1275201.1 DUF1549 domain-containing protein [Prosthecobacter sp.]
MKTRIQALSIHVLIALTLAAGPSFVCAKDPGKPKKAVAAEPTTANSVNADAKEAAVARYREMAKSGQFDRAAMEELAAILGAPRAKGGQPLSDNALQTALAKAVGMVEQRKKMNATGDLEAIQKAKLAFLKEKSGPFVEQTPSRELRMPHERIEWAATNLDKLVESRLHETGGDFNPLTTDEQFVRRIYLDAAGRIPTAEEAKSFLTDKSTTKRRDLIDKLLLSEDYPSQMYNWLADMLRVQDPKGAGEVYEGYQAWLMDQAAGNRPWNETVYNLLTAEGNLVTEPQIGWLNRDGGVITNTISQTLMTFLGADVSCAECHDHPFANWTQRQFYELAGFFGTTHWPGAAVKKITKVQRSHMHVVRNNTERFLTFPEDYKYEDVKPGSKVSPTFAVMRELAPRTEGTPEKPLGRQDFAMWLTNAKNTQFAATIANRLWHKAFGRAVIEPMTVMDDLNAADHPKLITTLASLMQYLQFDLMEFQRVVYNTRAYQSQCSLTQDDGEPARFAGPVLRRMTAEQAWDSLGTLISGTAINDYKKPRKLHMWAMDVFKEDAFEFPDRDPVPGKRIAMGASLLENELLVEEGMKLTAELLKSQGRSDADDKRGRKKNKSPAMARASELEQPAPDSHFLRGFGQSEREFVDGAMSEGGIPQVLMLMNGNEAERLAEPRSHLMQLANAAGSESAQIESMYLSFFSRRPTPSELSLIRSKNLDPQKLSWMLMNTREFIFVQ